jgi:hypothetical protein
VTGYNRYFRGRDIVILPDNDATGYQHGEDVAGHVERWQEACGWSN